MAEITRSYVLQVGHSEDAWTVDLLAADGSLLVGNSGYSAENALVEVAEFLEDEATRGFPTSRETV